MTQLYTVTANVILDAIIKTAMFYDIEGIEETSDREVVIHYAVLGQGYGISERINDMMREKCPNQDYRIKIYPKEQQIEVTLLERE